MPSSELIRRRALLIFLICGVLLTSFGIWMAFSILRPNPPHTVTMAIDPEGSFSAEIAKRYREHLARAGIELKLVPTAGAVESISLLNDSSSGVSVAIIPGGVITQEKSPHLVSLGTLFYEPIWIFYRGQVLQKHEQLRGLRISIGPEGSASHALSLEFLSRVGIINQRSATLINFPPDEAAHKLLDGEVDVVILLDAWETPLVQRLLKTEGVNFTGIRRPDAFVALYPYLNKLVLPAGVADLAENRPPTDVTLLAPKASLVVRDDLHPAIQYLLLDAASQIHSGPGIFRVSGQFPAPESVDLPLSTHAIQYHKTGSPFLQRNLPFWLAILIQQILVLLIPVAGVLLPLFRVVPRIFLWIEKRRVYKAYSELRLLEEEVAAAGMDKTDDDFIYRLDQFEDRISRLWVPPSLRSELYDLRSHIELVREEARRN